MLASVLIVFSGGIAGLVVANSYATRPEELKNLRCALGMLETEIGFGLTPLPEALNRVGRRMGGSVGYFFREVAAALNDDCGLSAGEAWEKCLGILKEEAFLSQGDLDILRSFGNTLGVSDRDDQIKHLRLAQEQLSLQEHDAEKLKEGNQRMWRTIGFLGGLAVVLILY